jgi:hypothetical protein
MHLQFTEATGLNGDLIWQIEEVVHRGLWVELDLIPVPLPMSSELRQVSSGRPVTQPDWLHGPTILTAVELPFDIDAPDQPATSPKVYLAASGGFNGWRGADLFLGAADQSSVTPLGRSALPAVTGRLYSALDTGNSLVFDDRSTVEVLLDNDAMILLSADRSQLATGSNLAKIGAEILQFGHAERMEGRLWRLRHLVRGLAGTDSEMGVLLPEQKFLLLDSNSLFPVTSSMIPAGSLPVFHAIGIGDEEPVSAMMAVAGLAMRPLSPVHARKSTATDGGVFVQWSRRSRYFSAWPDHVELPLGETQELYALDVLDPAQTRLQSLQVSEPQFLLPGPLLDDYRTDGHSFVTVQVRQIGTHAVSLPVSVVLDL